MHVHALAAAKRAKPKPRKTYPVTVTKVPEDAMRLARELTRGTSYSRVTVLDANTVIIR